MVQSYSNGTVPGTARSHSHGIIPARHPMDSTPPSGPHSRMQTSREVKPPNTTPKGNTMHPDVIRNPHESLRRSS